MQGYGEVLERLVRCRNKQNLTQTEFGKMLGIAQETYCKKETGKLRIEGELVEKLYHLGWDIDYILTGRNGIQNYAGLDEILSKFETGEQRDFAMKILAELLLQKLHSKGLDKKKQYKDNCELLRACLSMWEDFSMTYFIRKRENLTQEVIAARLGKDTRNYREIERGKVCPDVDIILYYYEQYHYRPILYLPDCDYKRIAIGMLWEMLSANERRMLAYYIGLMKDTLYEK